MSIDNNINNNNINNNNSRSINNLCDARRACSIRILASAVNPNNNNNDNNNINCNNNNIPATKHTR